MRCQFKCGTPPSRSSWECVIVSHSQTGWIGNPGGVAEVELGDGALTQHAGAEFDLQHCKERSPGGRDAATRVNQLSG